MSYYFCIVGTRDNPLYQAELASKPAGSGSAASFFGGGSSSSSSTTAASSASSASTAATTMTPGSSSSGDTAAPGGRGRNTSGISSTTGGVFGFGNALGAITSGFGGGTGRDSGGHDSSRLSTSSATAAGDAKGLGFGRYNDKHVLQMIAHSSLDVVEDKQFHSQAMYLKAVDRMNEWTTSAFIVPGNLKFLILHEHRHDDGIRNFFYDVWELVVKIILNPFHDLNDPITSTSFDSKVRASARKHL